MGQNRLIDQTNYSFQSLDITNETEVNQTKTIFTACDNNCAAMTNVDACELNQKQCWDVNVNGVKHLANAVAKLELILFI